MTTNEQIMIDGVDVSGCADFITEMTVPDSYAFVKLKNRCFQECKYDQTAEQDVYLPCRDNPNCYYKQLQRKTQECEEYFKQRNNIIEECQRYLEEIRKLQKSQFCVAYEKDCDKDCKQQNCSIKNSYCYRNALDEIEGKIKEINGSDVLTFPDLSLQENAKAIMRQCNKGYRDILDIIRKAKGEDQ